jgi:hypothetical protein
VTYKLEIPLKTISVGNSREHKFVKMGRVQKERRTVALFFPWQLRGAMKYPLAVCRVKLTRFGRGTLDEDDNLPASMKAVRDEISKQLGIDDGEKRIKFAYDQVRRQQHGVGVEIRLKTIELEQPFDASDYERPSGGVRR